jgi:hypothetical protein
VAHIVPHAASTQRYGAHAVVAGAGQLPMPSQVAAAVALPSAQLAVRHDVVAGGYVHAARWVPSQVPPQVPVPLHAERMPRGAPVTAVQVPTDFATSHASHWPLQAWLQHTPSAQKPVAQALLRVHAAPGGSRGVHAPAAQ